MAPDGLTSAKRPLAGRSHVAVTGWVLSRWGTAGGGLSDVRRTDWVLHALTRGRMVKCGFGTPLSRPWDVSLALSIVFDLVSSS